MALGAVGPATAAALTASQSLCPWHIRWSATGAEAAAPSPATTSSPERPTVSTRAVTVDAPPEAAWS